MELWMSKHVYRVILYRTNGGMMMYAVKVRMSNVTIIDFVMQLSSSHLSQLIPTASPEAISLISVSGSAFICDANLFMV